MVTVHVDDVPLHTPPPQPVNVSPVSGVAVSTTEVPELYSATHNAPQEISPFADVTRPGPNVSTFSGYVSDTVVPKVAVTLRTWDIEIVHVELNPVQSPLQP